MITLGELSKLINIGKTVEEQLNQVGIMTESDLNILIVLELKFL